MCPGRGVWSGGGSGQGGGSTWHLRKRERARRTRTHSAPPTRAWRSPWALRGFGADPVQSTQATPMPASWVHTRPKSKRRGGVGWREGKRMGWWCGPRGWRSDESARACACRPSTKRESADPDELVRKCGSRTGDHAHTLVLPLLPTRTCPGHPHPPNPHSRLSLHPTPGARHIFFPEGQSQHAFASSFAFV